MTALDKIGLRLLRVGLTQPYKLSFGTVAAFDTLLVDVELSDGRCGLGEATILTGYTEETLDQCWAAAREIAPILQNLRTDVAQKRLSAWIDTNPFTVTAFSTAIDMAIGHPTLTREGCRVPVLGIINATDPLRVEAEIEALLAQGYRTLKVKVGWEVGTDLARVRHVQRMVAGRARIRIDANQGYSAADGVAFAKGLDPDGIELFEQACAAGDWDAAIDVKRAAPVAIMLDESIYDMADVETAARLGAADIIKLKLMKLGSIDRLAQALARIADLGMTAVLGNGVATEIGCWMEACVAAKALHTAGEMNGFLKQKRGLLKAPLTVEKGCIVIPAGFAPTLDLDAVSALTVARQDYRVSRIRA